MAESPWFLYHRHLDWRRRLVTWLRGGLQGVKQMWNGNNWRQNTHFWRVKWLDSEREFREHMNLQTSWTLPLQLFCFIFNPPPFDFTVFQLFESFLCLKPLPKKGLPPFSGPKKVQVAEGKSNSTPSPLLPVPAGGMKVPTIAAKAPANRRFRWFYIEMMMGATGSYTNWGIYLSPFKWW